MFKIRNIACFGHLDFGIGVCLVFDICNLEFATMLLSSIPKYAGGPSPRTSGRQYPCDNTCGG